MNFTVWASDELSRWLIDYKWLHAEQAKLSNLKAEKKKKKNFVQNFSFVFLFFFSRCSPSIEITVHTEFSMSMWKKKKKRQKTLKCTWADDEKNCKLEAWPSTRTAGDFVIGVYFCCVFWGVFGTFFFRLRSLFFLFAGKTFHTVVNFLLFLKMFFNKCFVVTRRQPAVAFWHLLSTWNGTATNPAPFCCNLDKFNM